MATPAEIAASLTMDDIPVKLRCATCNKLANNAFRMPCCDQSICEDCQASLPEACPVCYHEPVKPDDCRPNKALRTTVKVFLRKKVVERENAEKKRIAAEKVAAAPATPYIEGTPVSQIPQTQAVAPDASGSVPSDAIQAQKVSDDTSQRPQTRDSSMREPERATPTEAQKDIPQMSIESPGPETARRASTQTAGDGSAGQDSGNQSEKPPDHPLAMAQSQQWAAGSNGFEQGMNNGSMGFPGAAGGFPNMGMNGMGDFSQMMNLMPNGMPNPMMGSLPNLIGMPGMSIDPMAMSQMYSGFGGQGMGMNSMNMGMGFDAGQGAFGGFNGQPGQWNAGQNNFNQNAYGNRANMGGIGGDYGTNTGYGGYNMPPHQGSYNQMHQHQYPNNDFHQGHHGQGFQYRGRGRGRGYYNAGRGRGGYNQYNQYNQTQGNQTNNEAFHQQVPEVTRRGSPEYGPQENRPAHKAGDEEQQDAKAEDDTNKLTAEEQLNKELDPGDAGDNNELPQGSITEGDSKAHTLTQNPDAVVPETKTSDQPEATSVPKEEDEKPAPIQTFISDEPSKQEASFIDTDAIAPSSMPPPPSPMVPTGPAAYNADHSSDTSPRGRGAGRSQGRETDSRGGSHGRGSGYLPNSSINHVQPATQVVKPGVPPVAPRGLGVEGAPTAPKALREGQPNTGIRGFSIVGRASAAAHARSSGQAAAKSPSRDRSRSRSHSPARHQSSHHRHHRHRSTSRSSSNERERRRERRHRHSRRHDTEDGDDYHHTKDTRHRDASAESNKRSSHRSRRHHDEDKDKDIERSSHRAHRSHRDRSRDGERESKKREKSPELTINGASRRKAANDHTSSRHKDTEETTAPSSSSRKRRSDDEHGDDHRDSKRKRRGHEEGHDRGKENDREKANGHRSSRPSKHEPDTRNSNHDRPPEKSLRKEPPKGPKSDNNSMLSEREKYAAERIARENQRRMSQMGGGGGGNGRRVIPKYEDEVAVSKGESEREALRFR